MTADNNTFDQARGSLTEAEKQAFDLYMERMRIAQSSAVVGNPSEIVERVIRNTPGAKQALKHYDQTVAALRKSR